MLQSGPELVGASDISRRPHGRGELDYVFFPVVQARYLRLASVPLSPDWGVSLFEFEPLAAAPRVEGLTAGTTSRSARLRVRRVRLARSTRRTSSSMPGVQCNARGRQGDSGTASASP